MFASIAHRYDLLNRLLSFSIDQRWRRFVRKTLESDLESDARILDLCTGTGDLALEMAKLGKTLGCDFCRPMLERGAVKSKNHPSAHSVWFVEGDALRVPVRDGWFDAVTIAFGLRNLAHPQKGMEEMLRVLSAGGRLAILEFSIPTLPVFRQLYLLYFKKILPNIGALISGKDGPYSYLPASVSEFAQPAELANQLLQVGFESVVSYPLTGGIVTLTVAKKSVSR
jgi:demethylmenaquinone methyltransferase/2-methoxy-6-polyprenyl-1,4-benzoquinol methylase